MNGERREPSQKHGNREVFIEEKVPYQNRDYLLVFWFENHNSDWLWVRNCYPIN
ncbi:MAG: tRNA lysidine(34) synthetase TilS [Candidatus Moeniiplasma glomeromycotorum]|nr:tRNA lysidine(34) synthetase TilS [Candidatus Moeniiplasma glomeromycotorum]MCE8167300.1 tRNA lysidine(34) synthetase TilS [Candidatus Moeniiplasma glomeromycotorum]MCE8168687.1 tRNA lysidine(34) synthetase TilS [Candidatus Moeniiplasma glomeromycotorum]